MNAEIKTTEPIYVLGLEHRGPYMNIGDKFARLGQLGAEQQWPATGMLGIYYDDPRTVPEADLRSKACAIVQPGFDPQMPELEAFTIPGGEHAVLRHVGSYAGLGESWRRLFAEELPRLGEHDTGPCFEIYVNHPGNASEDELITDLYAPVSQG